MPTTTNLFRYHVNSMAALNDRKELQQILIPGWEFQFPMHAAKAFVSDNIEVRDFKLHAGLKIIVLLEGTINDDIKSIATALAERILDMFSFVTLGQCDVPRLISHISIDENGKSSAVFFNQPDPESIIVIGTPRKINIDIFNTVWRASDGHQAESQVIRALEWFRKAIREKYIIDQFISYWVALEIANSALNNIRRKRMKKLSPWTPVTLVFSNKIKTVGFTEVYRARNDILHGLKPISPNFFSRIRTYITPVRNAIVYLLVDILGLDDAVANAITSNTVRRLFLDSAVGLKGTLENIPIDIKEILQHYPELITKGKPSKYTMRDTGELGITLSTDYTAKLPPKTTFKSDMMVVTGEEHSGITGVSDANLVDKQ